MLYTILVLETLYLSDEKKLYFFLSELVTGRRLESSFTWLICRRYCKAGLCFSLPLQWVSKPSLSLGVRSPDKMSDTPVNVGGISVAWLSRHLVQYETKFTSSFRYVHIKFWSNATRAWWRMEEWNKATWILETRPTFEGPWCLCPPDLGGAGKRHEGRSGEAPHIILLLLPWAHHWFPSTRAVKYITSHP